MNRMIKKLSHYLSSIPFLYRDKGTVAMEFALTLPIWIAIAVGASDSAYMMIISQRVDRVAYSVSDIITQSETLKITDLNNTFLAAGQLMEPFPFSDKGILIVTSIYQAQGLSPKIMWQYSGGGSLVRSSKIGAYGSTPTLPNGLTLNDNENVIVTEVYYVFDPMFINAGPLTSRDFYRVAVHKPRLSPIITPPT